MDAKLFIQVFIKKLNLYYNKIMFSIMVITMYLSHFPEISIVN